MLTFLRKLKRRKHAYTIKLYRSSYSKFRGFHDKSLKVQRVDAKEEALHYFN